MKLGKLFKANPEGYVSEEQRKRQACKTQLCIRFTDEDNDIVILQDIPKHITDDQWDKLVRLTFTAEELAVLDFYLTREDEDDPNSRFVPLRVSDDTINQKLSKQRYFDFFFHSWKEITAFLRSRYRERKNVQNDFSFAEDRK